MPSNALDLDLHDLDLLEEIGLVTDLMAAAEDTGRPLSIHEVDAVLFGVDPRAGHLVDPALGPGPTVVPAQRSA